MRVVIDKKLSPELTAEQEGDINAFRKEAHVAGTVMTKDDATVAFAGESFRTGLPSNSTSL